MHADTPVKPIRSGQAWLWPTTPRPAFRCLPPLPVVALMLRLCACVRGRQNEPRTQATCHVQPTSDKALNRCTESSIAARGRSSSSIPASRSPPFHSMHMEVWVSCRLHCPEDSAGNRLRPGWLLMVVGAKPSASFASNVTAYSICYTTPRLLQCSANLVRPASRKYGTDYRVIRRAMPTNQFTRSVSNNSFFVPTQPCRTFMRTNEIRAPKWPIALQGVCVCLGPAK